MSNPMIRAAMAWLAVLASVVPAPAEVVDGAELTLAEARERALASSPALAAAGAGVVVAESEQRQAGAWPNPELEAEAEELDGFLSRSAGSETTLALRQPLPVLSRRPRQDAARWSSEGARAGLDVTRLDLLAEVERRFATALAAQERLTLAEGSVATAREVAATVRALVEAGEVSPIELSRAEAEAAIVATELSSCRLGLETARLGLAETLGESAPSFGVLNGTLAGEASVPALDSLQGRLAAMPEQRRLESEEGRLGAELVLALRERWPEPAVRVGTFFRGVDAEPAYVAGISLQLPLWDRRQGAIAAARARQEIGRQLRRAEELRRGATLASAHAALVQARDETAQVVREVLPRAEEVFTAIAEGYRRGKFGLLEVLEARRSLASARQRALDARLRLALARVEVERLSGGALDGPPGGA
ncbi:MAG: TolC family protein [Thermoanaerobaculaceae bacterium]|jgi:cobalt-zinc-cadmium efflux system outer membrane protein|nr:TolC family protein [Thermoanaerobaculaceae bacterium]